ncbi:MAG TPA: hypothetical protein VKT22_09915 [Steroidobacteraceae bacterium]|nr:hypothetical protein [Steroidobacteraceae bacterium]
MATPINSTSNGDLWHLSIEDLLAAPVPQTPRLGGAGPFVISLTSSTAPITPPKDFSVDETTHVYQVQRMEDHRMRYRLRIGPFVTEDEADAALAKVRDVYPGALTATAETEDLRAILAWQAKRDALRLAAERAQSAMRSETVPFEIAAIPVLTTAVATRKAPPAATAKQPAQASGIPEVTSAPQDAAPARGLSASPAPQPPASSPPSPAATPVTAATAVMAKTAATSARAPAAKPPGARPPVGFAPIASDASARLQALAALNMSPISSPFAARSKAATSSKPAPRASRAAVAPSAAAGTPVASGAPAAGAVSSAAAAADAPAVNALAARIPPASSAVANISAPPPGSAGLSPPPPASASVTKSSIPAPMPFELSIDPPAGTLQGPPAAASVSAAPPLTHPSAMGSRRALPAGAWLRARSIGAVPPLTSPGALSSFARPPAPKPPAATPKASSAHPGSSELSVPNLESTQTVRALTPIEIESTDSPRWYVIQLGLSDTAFDPESLPNCDIINEYRLYSVTGFDQGRLIHALRLGFFGEEVAAAAVASYLAAYYEKPTVKRVSAAERERFAHHRVEARKDIGATGKHAVIEITNERVVRERRDASAPVPEISSSLIDSRPGSAPTPK